MTLSHLIVKKDATTFVARSLDFDLVEIGTTEDHALDCLMVAVKAYVEFGLSKGWNDYILCDAPDEFRITPDMEVRILAPLEIANVKRAMIAVRNHEGLRAA